MAKRLPKKLLQRPFSWKEAQAAGISQYALASLLTNGAVERVARGIYRAVGDNIDLSPEDQCKAALMRVGQPAAICMISALAYYHLTDIIPKQIWIMVNASKLSHHRDIRLWRRRNAAWTIGIVSDESVKITSIERTLVECLYYKDLVGGTAIALEALRTALRDKKTTISNVLKIAEKLGVKKKILPYIEVLI